MTPLVGTRTLAGLALRRDRIKLLFWVLLAAGLVAGTASSIKGLYATLAERQEYAVTIGANPASAVLGGPGFGLSTLGGITVAEVGSTLLALVALASILLVVRYTRTEEQTGRAELVGSAVVGRHARLAAALLVVGGANLMISAATIAVLIGYGLPMAGSLAFGLVACSGASRGSRPSAGPSRCVPTTANAGGSSDSRSRPSSRSWAPGLR